MQPMPQMYDDLMSDLFEQAVTVRGPGQRLEPISDAYTLYGLYDVGLSVMTSALGQVIAAGRDDENTLAQSTAFLDGIAELSVFKRLD